MAIQVLDQHTAELIAAGEVVERPSSVVKELCENAIDAGAKNITVEIEKGGIALMRIQDDGSGIAAEEIPTAFLRHATSKLRTKEDLDAINTLGFRGEALPSIASVSQVELLTKTEQDEFASQYSIWGGQEKGLEPAARPTGTTMTIRNLFYNTPARMKFLKKDTSEGTFVTEVVTRLALSHPDIAFRYIRDGKQIFVTPGDDKLQSVAYAVLGKEFARDLLEIEGGDEKYQIQGLVTPPRASRASRSMQFFYINGRFVKNRTMMAALEQAYRGMMMQGKFPGCVLFLQMPPELVDVNVHPAKTEVRFARESDIFDVVYKTVKNALVQATATHSTFAFDKKATAATPAQGAASKPVETLVRPNVKKEEADVPAAEQTPKPAYVAPIAGAGRITAYNQMVDTLAANSDAVPYQTEEKTQVPVREFALDIEPEEAVAESVQAREYAVVPPVEQPVEMQEAIPAVPAVEQVAFTSPEAEVAAPLRLVGEIFKTYILAEADGVLCVIDKHAAHERMIYEQLMESRNAPGAQMLMAPVNVTLSAAEKNALLQNAEALMAAGIEVDDFGGNGVLVRSVPDDVSPDNVTDLVIELAARLVVNEKDTMSEKTEWVLHSVACRTAIKAGDKSRPEELLELARKILREEIPPFCPHGRPVVLEITRKELEKQFGRLG